MSTAIHNTRTLTVKREEKRCMYRKATRNDFSRRLVNGFNADEMKNQNVNNNKAPDKNL